MAPFNLAKIRADFPILAEEIHGNPLIYLDNAATTHKPACVLAKIQEVYQHQYSNVHRAVHTLSERSTLAYEAAREKIRTFINAAQTHEIIFVRGTTEAINLIATCYGQSQCEPGDEIIISAMEHHSNIVPWQMLCERKGLKLQIIPILDNGELILRSAQKLFSPKTKMLAVTHISNVLGTINPVQELIAMAHAHGVPVLLDGAQAVGHMPVDVQALDCDFYAFSGHKLFGPTGIGILYGKEKWLSRLPPYQGGGDMIRTVQFEQSTYNDLPFKFEAGTPNFVDAIALGTAIDYLSQIGMSEIAQYETELTHYAIEKMRAVPGLKLIGTADHKIGTLSFVLDDIHPHDIATILDHQGIATRAGHHCAMPLMQRLKLPATARASLAFYNEYHEIDTFCQALVEIRHVFT